MLYSSLLGSVSTEEFFSIPLTVPQLEEKGGPNSYCPVFSETRLSLLTVDTKKERPKYLLLSENLICNYTSLTI